MIGDPKEKKELLEKLMLAVEDGAVYNNSRFSGVRSILDIENLFQLSGIGLKIVLGVGVVASSMLGLVQPLWLATFFSIIGSATAMIGLYNLYQFITRNNVYDSLINKAIRRVIQAQN
jgi:hypothetical protein